MYCPNCGQQLPDDALFCGNCGTKVSTSQPQETPNTEAQYSQPAYQHPAYQQPNQQPYQQPVQKQESPVLSTWALLCSLIFNPIVGIVLGIIGIKKTPSYRGKCIAAIIIGAVMMVVVVIIYIIYFALLAELGAGGYYY
ncbi:MAG: zinc ribbon domain-containing protein [Clostridia bacterium]|nr:zinc ribbon domain-containing protein [Clostridia bacterium]